MRRARQLLRIGLQRHPDVDVGLESAIRKATRIRCGGKNLQHAEVRTGGHDSGDRIRLIVEAKRGSDSIIATLKRAFPQALANQHD